LPKNDWSAEALTDHQITLQRRYVHNGDEFVRVKSDVVAYFLTPHHSPNSQDRAAECISELLSQAIAIIMAISLVSLGARAGGLLQLDVGKRTSRACPTAADPARPLNLCDPVALAGIRFRLKSPDMWLEP